MNQDFPANNTNPGNGAERGPYEKAMAILKAAMERRYKVLTETFVKEGPDKLKEMMDYDNEADWEDLFDYLVTKQGVVKTTVMNYMDFFKNLVADKGPQALRKVFRIEKEKYDTDFEEVFDLVAVSTGALYDYVKKERVGLASRVGEGKTRMLRNELGIRNAKYDGLWFEILDLLMNAVCDKYYDEREYDQGLMAFGNLMNSIRQQRSLRSYRKMWEFMEAGKA